MPINSNMPAKSPQRGAALLMAIIFATLLLVIASQMTWFYNDILLIKQQNKRQTTDQAFLSEAIVLFNNQSRAAHISNPEAYPPNKTPTPIPPVSNAQGQQMQLALIDGSAWLNSNQLATVNLQTPANPLLTYHQRLLQLESFGNDKVIVHSLIDWLDSNDTTIDASGAENAFYSGINTQSTQASLPANGEITHPSELCQLREVINLKAEDCQKLQRLLHFYPSMVKQQSVESKLNINSASATAIAALHPSLTPSAVNAWQLGKQTVLTNTSTLWQQAPFSSIATAERPALEALISVQSTWLIGLVQINYNNQAQSAKASDIKRYQLLLLRNTADGSATLVSTTAIH